MKMFPVKSSQIAEVGHESRTGMMRVKFTSGQTYDYGRVSPEQFKAMVMADSIGKFFHANIRGNTNHPVTKVNDSTSA